MATNHHDQSGQQDPTVGKGEIIVSDNYNQQQQQPVYYHSIEQPIHPEYSSPKTETSGCSSCWQPLLDCWNAENLRRSFCYGAIDGMLTGAGLVATLGGFRFFSLTKPQPWLVAFTFVACTADALCMALGHVWSTHVLSTHAANERRDERQAFTSNQNESKAKLVDSLLSRGMLKIDAVSIADILEGYPEIIVGALVGDAVVLHDTNPVETKTLLSAEYSYGQFNEWEHDPDAACVQVAVAESRTEALVMFTAFSLFGSVPSVLYYGVAQLEGANQQGMSASSAAITLTCVCMWCLGMWKSKFFDSNWIIFGSGTVVVLMVCIVSAYALGCGLSQVVTVRW